MKVKEFIAICGVLSIILIVPLIPIAMLIQWLSPTTFWQNLATVGVMMIFYTILVTIWGTIVVALLED